MIRAEQNAILRKWRSWVKKIQSDITSLVINLYLGQELHAILQANRDMDDQPDDIIRWMSANFTLAISVRIRRACDSSKDAISLRRLIDDMIDNHDALTRDAHVRLYRRHRLTRIGHITFDNLARRTHAKKIGRKSLIADRRRLEAVEERIRLFVNRRLAHNSTRPMTLTSAMGVRQVHPPKLKHISRLSPSWKN